MRLWVSRRTKLRLVHDALSPEMWRFYPAIRLRSGLGSARIYEALSELEQIGCARAQWVPNATPHGLRRRAYALDRRPHAERCPLRDGRR